MNAVSAETFSDEQIRWYRFRRSGLARGESTYPSPEAAAAALVGVQAQILSAATLSFWNRSETGAATSEEFLARLHEARSLIKLWGQRHTVHVYDTADWPVVQAAFSTRLNWWEREAKRHGAPGLLDEYRSATARIAALLAERGTMGRRDLRALEDALPAPLLSPWGGVFSALVRDGLACHAKWEGGEARYAHRSHWLPELPWSPPSPLEAALVLARRYFHAYGPATLQDFVYWAGLAAADVRPSLRIVAAELVKIRKADGSHLFLLPADVAELAQTPPPRDRWTVRLLGRFDPLLLAHRDKSWVVPEAFYARVWRPAGHIEGVVLVHGQAVAAWRYERVGSTKLKVRVFPFKRPSDRTVKAVQREARGVARFLGLRLEEVIWTEVGVVPPSVSGVFT